MTQIVIFEEMFGDRYFLFDGNEELDEICHLIYLERTELFTDDEKAYLKKHKEKYPYVSLLTLHKNLRGQGFSVVTPENDDNACFAGVEEEISV